MHATPIDCSLTASVIESAHLASTAPRVGTGVSAPPATERIETLDSPSRADFVSTPRARRRATSCTSTGDDECRILLLRRELAAERIPKDRERTRPIHRPLRRSPARRRRRSRPNSDMGGDGHRVASGREPSRSRIERDAEQTGPSPGGARARRRRCARHSSRETPPVALAPVPVEHEEFQRCRPDRGR